MRQAPVAEFKEVRYAQLHPRMRCRRGDRHDKRRRSQLLSGVGGRGILHRSRATVTRRLQFRTVRRAEANPGRDCKTRSEAIVGWLCRLRSRVTRRFNLLLILKRLLDLVNRQFFHTFVVKMNIMRP